MNWPDFKSLKVIRPVRVITDEMVASEVLEQRLVAGTSEELKSGFEVGDVIQAEVELFEVERQSPAGGFQHRLQASRIRNAFQPRQSGLR